MPWFIRDPKKEKAKVDVWRTTLEKKRRDVQWIEKHRKELNAESRRWQLLASFRRNLEANLEIGDASSLDMFIREEDLAALNFGDVVGEWPTVL